MQYYTTDLVFDILNIVEKLLGQERERKEMERAATDVKGENPSEQWRNTEVLTRLILFKVNLSKYDFLEKENAYNL